MKNSKVVSFLSPFKVGKAGNLWTLPRTSSVTGNVYTCKKIRWAELVAHLGNKRSAFRVLAGKPE